MAPVFAGGLLQYNKIDEIPEGPGLFSKGSEDGIVVFSTICSSKISDPDDDVETLSTPEAANSNLPRSVPADDEEYQKFLDWQWRQFQQWKKKNESDN